MPRMSITCLNSEQRPGRNIVLRHMSSVCRKQQAGFALVSGVFILVTLATLGAFMVKISGMQQTSSALDVLGTRAYHAARSGIEWGAYQVTTGTNGSPFAQACAAAQQSQAITLAETLAEFTVTVNCEGFVDQEGGKTVTIYQITSTAHRGTINSAHYVERQLQATMAR